ncbi:MAG: transporter substrate-binding domain-containing protein [Desulfovibrio sp.]|nr:transporter substrate-binding domain-containing protein [Desulfovibrio sp.]MBI4957979.1 transporter substrate-binding domain-containing protein [Desulfovibrio sp.]
MARPTRVVTSIFILTALFWATAEAKTFTVLTGEWLPYTSESLECGGPMACVVKEAVAVSGHTVLLEFVPWRRNELEVLSGAALATFPWSRTSAFEKNCYASTPLGNHQMAFFYLEKKLPGWNFTTLEELKKHRIGGSRGYAYVEIFEAAGIQADYAQDVEKSFVKLFTDRVDLVVENEIVGWAVLEKNHLELLDQIAVAKTPLFVRPLHVMVSKTHPDGVEFLEVLNRGLALLKQSGRLDVIGGYGVMAPAGKPPVQKNTGEKQQAN